jgi:hypothetical protein
MTSQAALNIDILLVKIQRSIISQIQDCVRSEIFLYKLTRSFGTEKEQIDSKLIIEHSIKPISSYSIVRESQGIELGFMNHLGYEKLYPIIFTYRETSWLRTYGSLDNFCYKFFEDSILPTVIKSSYQWQFLQAVTNIDVRQVYYEELERFQNLQRFIGSNINNLIVEYISLDCTYYIQKLQKRLRYWNTFVTVSKYGYSDSHNIFGINKEIKISAATISFNDKLFKKNSFASLSRFIAELKEFHQIEDFNEHDEYLVSLLYNC